MPGHAPRRRPGLATASLIALLALAATAVTMASGDRPPGPAVDRSPAPAGAGTVAGSLDLGPVVALPAFTVLDTTFNSGLYTSLRRAPDGLPALSYYDDTNGAVHYARCRDPACADATSTVVDDEGVTGLATSLAYDAEGLPVISYYDLDVGAVRLAWCRDPDCGTSHRMLVDAAVPDVTLTALTIGPDGRAEIAYAAGATTDLAGLHIARCDRRSCDRQRIDGPAIGQYVSSDRQGGDLVVVYRDEAGRRLRLAHCASEGCTVSSPDPTAGAGLQPTVVVAPDGTTVVAHLDLSGQALKLLRCTDPSCSASDTAVVADTAGAGFFPALALRADGAATVAYYDESSDALWLAACIDLRCSAVERNVVDALGIVGVHTSMLLGVADRPLIAYHDQTNRHLKVVDCGNLACAAPLEAATLGRGAASFVDADGRPGIVYRSPRPRDIRIARCLERSCNRTAVTPVDTRVFVGLHGGGATTAAGVPVVTYADSGEADLRLSTCIEGGCAVLDSRELATSGNVGTFAAQSLAGDRLAVAHLDRTRGEVRLLTCALPACATAEDVVVAEVGAGAGAIAVDHVDGRPVLAHHDPGTGRLVLTDCDDAACRQRHTVVVADAAAPLPVALRVDGTGRAWMLHRDAGTGALRLTHCADLRCLDARTVTVSRVGVQASLVLLDGVPVMAYLEDGRGLVLARCRDLSCSGMDDVVLSTSDGHSTSLATGPSGEVVVGTLDLRSEAPVLLRCPDAACRYVERIPMLTRARR